MLRACVAPNTVGARVLPVVMAALASINGVGRAQRVLVRCVVSPDHCAPNNGVGVMTSGDHAQMCGDHDPKVVVTHGVNNALHAPISAVGATINGRHAPISAGHAQRVLVRCVVSPGHHGPSNAVGATINGRHAPSNAGHVRSRAGRAQSHRLFVRLKEPCQRPSMISIRCQRCLIRVHNMTNKAHSAGVADGRVGINDKGFTTFLYNISSVLHDDTLDMLFGQVS